MRHWARSIRTQWLAIALGLVIPVISRGGDARYDSGNLIDLATVRGVVATASDSLRKDQPPAGFLLHRAEGEIRFNNNFGPCWWMMRLPGGFEVSDIRLSFRDVITSIGLQIKTADDPPADWKSVPIVAAFDGALQRAASGQHVVELHFNARRAKYVRIEFLGQNGGEHGAGSGHQDLVVSGLQVWGPNDPPVGSAISVAQSAWADGACTLHDCTTDDRAADGTVTARPPRDCDQLVDDNDPGATGDAVIATFFAKGSPATGTEQTDEPARFVVTLKNRVKVTAVAYSATTDDRVERPRDVKIYTSAFTMGDAWRLEKEVRDIQGGSYEEIALDKPAAAQRVRFDVERVWNSRIDPQRKAAEGHLAQLYVYGESLPADIAYSTAEGCQASCQILDGQGKIVRLLQVPTPVQRGRHGIDWDGLDDLGNPMPGGTYDARVILNPAVYKNMGAIGNTATPATIDQNPSQIGSVATDATGNVYTADGWDEASQDFRKWDRDTGAHVFDAHGEIRSGNPNGLAYAIAVDDRYIYCATTSHTDHGQQHIRRFRLADGEPAPFPAGGATGGHILVHDRPDDEIPGGTDEATAKDMRTPLHAMVVAGDKLFVTDTLAGKILSFDRETGSSAGSLDSNMPLSLAVDSKGRLWVGHEDGSISVREQDGSQFRVAYTGLGHIQAMAFGPDDTLYVADSAAGRVLVYSPNGASRIFGQKAAPGDYTPDHFYTLTALAVDRMGNLIVAQELPVDGSRLARFAPDGKVIWDQLGGEFCNTGNFSAEHPDEILTQDLHRYIVDKQTGKWEFRGSVLDGEARYLRWPHGPMRVLKLGTGEFICQGFGDGLQVYRREGDVFRLCSMFGCVNPLPGGIYRDAMTIPDDQRPQKKLWSWQDANGDGKVDDEEIEWEEDSDGAGQWSHFGINVDQHGNALLCEFNNSIMEVPMTGFDDKGNLVYGMLERRIVIPPDGSPSPVLSDPIMAVRGDDGSIYAFSRSKVFPAPPESGGGWMAGWMLARYDGDGNPLWYTRLPEACPGMDHIPGGGVMLVSMKSGKNGCDIYHYTPEGALIGIFHPSPQFLDPGGIPDNTGSLSVSRDPRDGLLDVLVEDCLGNRFYWYRVDDRRKPTVLHIGVQLTAPGSALKSNPF